MVTRRLQLDEWDKADKLFREHFQQGPPDPGTSVVVVAEEDGQIVGFLTLQLILHAEPLWVSDSCKTKTVISRLIGEALRFFPNPKYVFANTKNAKVARLLTRLGFTQLPWLVFRWLPGGTK